jgi:hypothetical protein
MDWAEIRRTAKNVGWAGVAYDLHYRALNHITLYMVLQGMTVTMETLDHQFLAGPDRFRYGFLDEATLRRYSPDPSNRLGGAFLDQALRKGDSCYAVLDGETLAAFGWYSNKPTHINEDLQLHFHPSWIYMYHGHTRDEYRGQRLHGVGMAKATEAFTQRGFRGLISYVEANNFSSLKSVYRMGYRNFGRVSVLRMLGRHIIRRDAACREFEFDVKEASAETAGSLAVPGKGT